MPAIQEKIVWNNVCPPSPRRCGVWYRGYDPKHTRYLKSRLRLGTYVISISYFTSDEVPQGYTWTIANVNAIGIPLEYGDVQNGRHIVARNIAAAENIAVESLNAWLKRNS